MNIIKYKYIFLIFSGMLVAVSIAAFAFWGLKLGIDFTGGSLLEAEFTSGRPSTENIAAGFKPLELRNMTIQPTGERGVILRFRDIDEPTHQKILNILSLLQHSGPGIQPQILEKRFDTVGPTIGAELKRRTLIALGIAVGMIVLYIAWAFRRVSKPVSSWKYGVVAVIALIHDVSIPVGIFSFLGKFHGVEVDILFITALLTILGFSVHDTIVVFDRIRENLRKLKITEPFETTVNRSINETISRSINTSLTVLLVLAAILLFGGASTYYFALTLIIGIVFGTYSSIFIASPLLVVWNKFFK